jgi:hypothetical protein
MLDAGITVALSSDAPVVEDDNPLAGITAAVTRRDRAGQPLEAEQAITAAEALDAYTRGGAVAVGLHGTLGAIAEGFHADLAVLSDDPLVIPADELSAITVEQTWLAGQCVYERP